MKRILFIFLLLVIVKAIIALQFPSPWVMGDETIYTAKTRAMLQGNFNFDEFHFGGPRVPPLYSFFLMPAYFFNNPSVNYQLSLIINILLSSLIIFPAYFLAKRFLESSQALLLASLVAVYPSLSGYSLLIMSESLFFPLFLSTLWFFALSFEKKHWIFHALLGLSLGALAITRVVGIFPIFIWVILSLASLRTQTLIPKLISFVSLIIPIGFWSFVKDGSTLQSTGGYELSEYFDAIKIILTDSGAFFKAMSLQAHEIGYTFAATFFIFPLMFLAGFFMKRFDDPRQKLYRFLSLFVLFVFILFLGTSIAHQYLFSLKDSVRYLVFGRYIDPILPAILLLGGIMFFRLAQGLALQKRILMILFLAIVFSSTILFLPNSNFDLINNFPIFPFRNTDFLHHPPLPWILLFFASGLILLFPRDRLKKMFILLCIIFSIAVIIPAISVMHGASHERAKKLGAYHWIAENMPYGEVIGFDQDGLWEKNTIHLFWLYEFWFGKNYHLKITAPNDTVKYLLSYRDLSLKKLYSDQYLSLYAR